MTKTFKISKDRSTEDLTTRVIEELFAPLLAQGTIQGLLAPRKTTAGGIVSSLLQNLQGAELFLFSPNQVVNAAELVSDLTFKEPADKLAVLLKPCEVRALVELKKLQQVNLDHLLLIGVDCLGTCEPGELKELLAAEQDFLSRWLKSLRAGEVEEIPLRKACQYCQHPATSLVDINLALVGSEPGEILLTASSEEGEKLLAELGLAESEIAPERSELLKAIKEERRANWQQKINDFSQEIADITGLIATLDLCRTCHNCRRACPICYCQECVFTTEIFLHEGRKYLNWAERKGAIKMPADTLLFHLTRLNHMGLSCVACGQCESACPNDIPLLEIFKLVGERAQEFFSYLPGEDLEEPLPLTTYEEDELTPN